MKLLMLGIVLLIALAGCRKSNPPSIDICIGDGYGGMNCTLKDGTHKYLKPSETANMWATTQEDMKLFASWCYNTSVKNVAPQMELIKADINGDNTN